MWWAGGRRCIAVHSSETRSTCFAIFTNMITRALASVASWVIPTTVSVALAFITVTGISCLAVAATVASSTHAWISWLRLEACRIIPARTARAILDFHITQRAAKTIQTDAAKLSRKDRFTFWSISARWCHTCINNTVAELSGITLIASAGIVCDSVNAYRVCRAVVLFAVIDVYMAWIACPSRITLASVVVPEINTLSMIRAECSWAVSQRITATDNNSVPKRDSFWGWSCDVVDQVVVASDVWYTAAKRRNILS